MSYKQIDEQTPKKFSEDRYIKSLANCGRPDIIEEGIRKAIDQAKAEQREECKKLMAQSNEWWNKKLKEATAIRQEGK